jgi:hypothetical protein
MTESGRQAVTPKSNFDLLLEHMPADSLPRRNRSELSDSFG